jgi:hypothetical protein
MTDEKWLELAKGQFKVGDNPTEEQINAKAQELKDEKANAETKKASGKQKLLDLGLTEEEVKALIGI